MKDTTIQKIIRQKLDKWIDSIEDKSLARKVRDNLILTGGAIVSMLSKEEINDYDIYIQNKIVLMDLIRYYLDKIKKVFPSIVDDDPNMQLVTADTPTDKDTEELNDNRINGFAVYVDSLEPDQIGIYIESGIWRAKKVINEEEQEVLNSTPFMPLVITQNAITLSNKIQIIIRFHGTPEEIHSNFDYIHVTNYFTYKDGLVVNDKALLSLITKKLYYMGSKYPITSVIRAKKYVNRGYSIGAGEFLKMAFQISKLDLTDLRVLAQQLIGVDVAYFEQLITELKAWEKDNPDAALSDSYLFQLIDKIFNEV